MHTQKSCWMGAMGTNHSPLAQTAGLHCAQGHGVGLSVSHLWQMAALSPLFLFMAHSPSPQFTDRVFGLPPQHFVGKHGLMLRTLRWQLVPGTLPNILHPLHSFLRRELEVNPLRGRVGCGVAWGGYHAAVLPELAAMARGPLTPSPRTPLPPHQVDLCKYIQDITFRSSVSTFFGSSFLEEVDVASLLQSFQTFESGFEMAASPVPLCLQWPFLRARSRLVETFR